MNIALDLAKRAEERCPVRVGLIGSGEMGTDIVTQLALMPGIDLAVLAEARAGMAWAALEIAGIPREAARLCRRRVDAEDAIAAGKIAITPDGTIPCSAA